MTIIFRHPVRIATIALALVISLATLAMAHDLFLKPDAFFVAPNGTVHLTALNGTFSTSEGAVSADRLLDLAIASPAGTAKGDTTAWRAQGKASRWTATVGAAGTYVFGTSLRPRLITLDGAKFNAYLADDGLPDILAARKAGGELARGATERYAKHVKALVQVGDALRVRALVDGAPVANQVVLAGGRTASGGRIKEQSVRTDASGEAAIRLATPGTWYVKFIRMTRIAAAAHDSVDYESKWATLTFAVR
jgi:uncharacterized GH25 family protein